MSNGERKSTQRSGTSPSAAKQSRSESSGSTEVQEANPEELKPYFMSVARVFARLSKDPDTKVGACIVNEQNQIVGVGYNEMPEGWEKEHGKADVVHAEDYAIRNATTASLKGCKIFITLNPCPECADLIINHSISEVFYMEDKDKEKYKRAKQMLKSKGIPHSLFCRRDIQGVQKSLLSAIWDSIASDV